MSNSHRPNKPQIKPSKKSQSLTKRAEFLRLQRKGVRVSTPTITAYISRPPRGLCGKIGYTVSKRVGNAPTRNLVKRRLRHLARLNHKLWNQLLVSLVAKPAAAQAEFFEIETHFQRIFAAYQKKSRGTR